MTDQPATYISPRDAPWHPGHVALLAAALASAGVPLYVHLPRFAAETGLGLGTIGGMLLLLRVVDVAQDPVLGLIADRFRHRRAALAVASFAAMAAGFLTVFALQPGLPLMVAGLVLLFTGFSLGTILFYGRGAELAGPEGSAGHYRLAGWREAGTLAGIVLAATLPALLTHGDALAGYALSGLVLAAAALAICWISLPFWADIPAPAAAGTRFALRPLLAAGGGRLLAIALLNSLPVAVTSTLFLFFVEDRLQLPGLAGGYLVLFFAAAGLSAPFWSRLAARVGARRVLVPAMATAIAAFGGTAFLPPGAAAGFAIICLMSGIAVGADLVVLPARYAATLSGNGLPTGTAFAAWAFAGKLSLALAAALVLPALQGAGYRPGPGNTDHALQALTLAYAVVPCLLKLPALILVLGLPDEET